MTCRAVQVGDSILLIGLPMQDTVDLIIEAKRSIVQIKQVENFKPMLVITIS